MKKGCSFARVYRPGNVCMSCMNELALKNYINHPQSVRQKFSRKMKAEQNIKKNFFVFTCMKYDCHSVSLIMYYLLVASIQC